MASDTQATVSGAVKAEAFAYSAVSVLERIFDGTLHPSSVVEETSNQRLVTLTDHPELSPVWNLARSSAGVCVLKDDGAWLEHQPTIVRQLSEESFSRFAYELFIGHATGFLLLSSGSRRRSMALSAGLPVVVASNILGEGFGRYLLRKGVISVTEAGELWQTCRDETMSLGKALLGAGKMRPAQLEEHMRIHAQLRLLPAFSWRQGKAEFFADERASIMRPLINLSFMQMARAGIWRNRPSSLSAAKTIAARLLHSGEHLKLKSPAPTVLWELDDTERLIVVSLEAGETLSQLLSKSSDAGDQARLIKSLYILWRLGIVEL